MIKLLKILTVLIFPGLQVYAQQPESGITFRHDAFNDVLQESARTGKLVFIDCYTSWCSPCKWMEKNIFVNDTAAGFYNSHFINYKIDMEKGEGPALRKRYDVQVFPTYLFINSNGTLVHKATSRMELAEFIEEGKKALDPARSLSSLQKTFAEGNRSSAVLLAYAQALQRTDRNLADSISQLLVDNLKDEELKTSVGWAVIQAFAREENSRLGKYFLSHRDELIRTYGAVPVAKVQERLMYFALNDLLHKKDSVGFFKRLAQWKTAMDPALQKKALMLEADFFLDRADAANFIRITNEGLQGLLRDDDISLSYIARRCQYLGAGNTLLLKQAYKLAKRATVVRPGEYSNQSTLAKICQDNGNKEEALQAAEAAYQLSLQEASKIQGLAHKQLEEIKKMK